MSSTKTWYRNLERVIFHTKTENWCIRNEYAKNPQPWKLAPTNLNDSKVDHCDQSACMDLEGGSGSRPPLGNEKNWLNSHSKIIAYMPRKFFWIRAWSVINWTIILWAGGMTLNTWISVIDLWPWQWKKNKNCWLTNRHWCYDYNYYTSLTEEHLLNSSPGISAWRQWQPIHFLYFRLKKKKKKESTIQKHIETINHSFFMNNRLKVHASMSWSVHINFCFNDNMYSYNFSGKYKN